MKKRLLFVDDEPNVLEGLHRLLHDHRKIWDMTFLSSAEEALRNCHVNDYDVLVTDFLMPGKDGFALLQTLRNTERTKDIPIVILTGAENSLQQTNVSLLIFLESPTEKSIVSTDKGGNFLYWNKGAEKMLGYSAVELVGRKNIKFLYPEDLKNIEKQKAAQFFMEHKKAQP